jgi:TolA-binding protein
VDKADDDYNMAAWLYASKKYDMAAEEFRAFIAKHPGHEKVLEARLTLARALLHLKRYDEAAAALQDLRKVAPKFERMAEVLFELGRAYAASGKAKEAADTFGAFLRSHGNHYLAQWAMDQRGGILITLKQYDEAEKTLAPLVDRFLTGKDADKRVRQERERLAKISPAVASAFDASLERAHLNLGLARFAAEKFDSARQTFEEFLALAPKSDLGDLARFNLAQSLSGAGQHARAAETYAALAKGKGPYAADAAYEAGRALYAVAGAAAEGAERTRKYREAAEAFHDCAGRFPQAEYADKARLYAGTCLYLAQDYNGAAGRLRDKVKATPGDAEAWYWLGLAQLKLNRAGDARAAFESSIKAAPTGDRAADALMGRADALLAEGRQDEAAQAFQEFAARHRDHQDVPRALYAAAAALHQAEKYDASDAVAAQFLAHPKAAASDLVPRVLFISGENRFLLKKYQEAAERYGELVSKHRTAEDIPAARFRLAWIRYFDKQYGAALAEVAEALKAKDAPFKSDAEYLAGNCHFEKGDYAKAVEALDRYLGDRNAIRHRDDAMLKAALALVRMDRAPDAIARLQQFLKDQPKSGLRPRAHYELAELLRAAKKFDEAAQEYAAVTRQADRELAPYAFYGLGTCRFETGAWAEAAEAFGQVPRAYAASDLVPQALHQQGLALQKAGNFGAARAAFEALTAKYAKHDLAASGYLGLGVCLQKEKKFPEAAEAFRRLAAAASKDRRLREQALYELAWSLQEAGQQADALKAYADLAREFPKGALAADAYFQMAEARYAEKQYPEATDLYEKALGAAVDDRLKDKILYRLGWCKWAAEKYEESARLFDRLAAECPASDLVAEATFQAAESYVRLGKPADAIARFQRLLDPKFKDFPRLADARFRLGEAQLVLGRDQEAVATLTALEQAAADYPAMAEVQFNLGRALYNLKRHDQARTRFERVTGMTETETAAKAQFYLGETYLAEGNPRDALKAYLRVVALWASYKEWAAAAQFEIGKAYLALGKPQDAREAFQAVVTNYGDTKWAQPAKEQLQKSG